MTANEMESLFRLKYDGLYEFTAPDISQETVSSLLTNAQLNVVLRMYMPSATSNGFGSTEKIKRDLEPLLRTVKFTTLSASYTFTGSVSVGSKTITVSSVPATVVVGDYIYCDTSIFASGFAIVTEIGQTYVKVDAASLKTGAGNAFTTHCNYLASQTDAHPNGVMFKMPSNFLYSVEEGVQLKKVSDNTLEKECVVKPVTHDEYSANVNNPYKAPYNKLVWRLGVGGNTSLSNISRTELIVPSTHTINYYRNVFVSNPPDIVCGETEENCILNEAMQIEIINEAVVMASAANKQENYQVSLNESNRS